MRYKRKKNKAKQKKNMECAFMLKRMGCAQGRKNARSKYTYKIHRITKYYNLQNFVLDKCNIEKVHYFLSFSCRRCFFSFHGNVVEDLISFGIEDHTFGPTKVREHFPEEKLIGC